MSLAVEDSVSAVFKSSWSGAVLGTRLRVALNVEGRFEPPRTYTIEPWSEPLAATEGSLEIPNPNDLNKSCVFLQSSNLPLFLCSTCSLTPLPRTAVSQAFILG